MRALLPALVVTLALAVAAPAHADTVTLGSDLSGSASITEAHGADTAFWPITIAGQGVSIPADGQILSVKVKGSVLKDPSPGAPDPATLIHFQSLEPAAADGSRTVYLTSQGFDMPVGDPTAITTFTPENLCVHQDGAFDLNEIGGYAWGGSLAAPINLQYYPNGTPFEVFAPARTSSTARYTADNGTNNGATLSPSGSTTQGEELLMQVVLATGDDRSQSCGGPRRHPDGTLVVTAPLPTAMHIREQRAYVSNNRSLAPTAFCPSGVPSCVGTATLTSKGKKIASARFTAPASKTAHIAMKLSPAAFRAMKKAKGHALRVTFTIVTSVGTYTHLITIRH